MTDEEHELAAPITKSYTSWILHNVLYVALLGWGLGTKLESKHLSTNVRKPIDVIVPGSSLVVICCVLLYIWWFHPLRASPLVTEARFAVIAVMVTAVCLAGPYVDE